MPGMMKLREEDLRERIKAEWEQMLLDYEGNKEAGYKPSRSWFIEYAEERIKELRE